MTADSTETAVDYVGGVLFPAIADIIGMVHYADAAEFLLCQGSSTHRPSPDCIIKCLICGYFCCLIPYFVVTRESNHLILMITVSL